MRFSNNKSHSKHDINESLLSLKLMIKLLEKGERFDDSNSESEIKQLQNSIKIIEETLFNNGVL